jgi:hypothetical protein
VRREEKEKIEGKHEDKCVRMETGFRQEGATAEERWKDLSLLSQMETRGRKRNGLTVINIQWAEIQINRENRNQQKRIQGIEGTIAWTITVEDLGWMITLSQPLMQENINTYTHIAETQGGEDPRNMGRTENMNTPIIQSEVNITQMRIEEDHENTPYITTGAAVTEGGDDHDLRIERGEDLASRERIPESAGASPDGTRIRARTSLRNSVI